MKPVIRLRRNARNCKLSQSSQTLTKNKSNNFANVTDWSARSAVRAANLDLHRNTSSGTYSEFKNCDEEARLRQELSRKMAGNEQIAPKSARIQARRLCRNGLHQSFRLKVVSIDGATPSVKSVQDHLIPTGGRRSTTQWRNRAV